MKIGRKLVAFALSLSMLAVFSPYISAYAEDSSASGTFNEIFSWEFSGDTLTFSVDDSVDSEYGVKLTTGTSISEWGNNPWSEYLPQVKNIVFDDLISTIGSDIWVDFEEVYAKEVYKLETVTFGEYVDVIDNWYFNETTTVYAPKYSYTDYTAFLEGVSFVPNGIAADPYFEIKNDDLQIEYVEDSSLLKMSGTINEDYYWWVDSIKGRYRTVLLQDGANVEEGYESRLKSCFVYKILSIPSNRIDLSSPVVLCYPSLGDDNIEVLKSSQYHSGSQKGEYVKVVVFGESNPELKGDANLDGSVDIDDATLALTYYANKVAGFETSLNDDEELNKFAYYLADTDTESTNGADSGDAAVDLADATNILEYYAQSVAGFEPDWQTIIQGN